MSQSDDVKTYTDLMYKGDPSPYTPGSTGNPIILPLPPTTSTILPTGSVVQTPDGTLYYCIDNTPGTAVWRLFVMQEM